MTSSCALESTNWGPIMQLLALFHHQSNSIFACFGPLEYEDNHKLQEITVKVTYPNTVGTRGMFR